MESVDVLKAELRSARDMLVFTEEARRKLEKMNLELLDDYNKSLMDKAHDAETRYNTMKQKYRSLLLRVQLKQDVGEGEKRHTLKTATEYKTTRTAADDSGEALTTYQDEKIKKRQSMWVHDGLEGSTTNGNDEDGSSRGNDSDKKIYEESISMLKEDYRALTIRSTEKTQKAVMVKNLKARRELTFETMVIKSERNHWEMKVKSLTKELQNHIKLFRRLEQDHSKAKQSIEQLTKERDVIRSVMMGMCEHIIASNTRLPHHQAARAPAQARK